ncbi:MAG: hypothetical protein LBP68_08965 [Acidobacteriota bacterium]|jgi:hypothetical protein|nr:hypothetical protein [Acidobacteriota bacterium]
MISLLRCPVSLFFSFYILGLAELAENAAGAKKTQKILAQNGKGQLDTVALELQNQPARIRRATEGNVQWGTRGTTGTKP